MGGLIVACVRTGTMYPIDYVERLRNMVARHLDRDYEMVCLTDQPERCSNVVFIDVTEMSLSGWWAKMLLFEPTWRDNNKIIYLDLDTVILRDIAPLADVPGEFAILENYTRLKVNPSYPCVFNSSVMIIGGGLASYVWTRFERSSDALILRHRNYGDQACIEELVPDATILQQLLTREFFINYRLLTMHRPKAAIVNFGGRNKPHNCEIPWVIQEWA